MPNIVGTAMECARHYRSNCGGDLTLIKLFAEWSGVSYSDSALCWFKGDYSPAGVNLLRLQVFLSVLGYEITEWRALNPNILLFGKAIALGIIDVKNAALLIGLNEQSIHRLVLGRSGTSDSKLSIIKDFLHQNSTVLVDKENALRDKVTPFISAGKPKLAVVKTDQKMSATAGGSLSSEVKRSILESISFQVNAMLPIAKLIASDAFSPEEREYLRKMSGKFNIFNLKNALVMLCGERARETGIQHEAQTQKGEGKNDHAAK